jgi:hypothetical protein
VLDPDALLMPLLVVKPPVSWRQVIPDTPMNNSMNGRVYASIAIDG